MSQNDDLLDKYPTLGKKLPRLSLASLPTPVKTLKIDTGSGSRDLSIKYDNLTGSLYGGNKVRKLEYIFAHAIQKHCEQIATFGAVGSNHALATALYAKQVGLECTCFLSHQAKTSLTPATLNRHIENRTRLVRFGGAYPKRLRTLREHLWGRKSWVIPMGGSSWLGNLGFVTAGLELARQIESGDIERPDRIYIGCGTMGTTIGVALGLAAANMPIEIHAVRVSDKSITNRKSFDRLLQKTVAMMRRLDESVPSELTQRVNVVIREGFFGPGYAQTTEATEHAMNFAKQQLDLGLEGTYTGKTMAALLADLGEPASEQLNILYWHTYNSVPVGTPVDKPLDEAALPPEFLRYFD